MVEPGDNAAKREVRIDRIGIQDYKALESLALELPPPKTDDEPDAFVLGSKNGVGKTSVLEACAIGLLSGAFLQGGQQSFSKPSDILVRSGAGTAVIETRIRCDGEIHACRVVLSRKGITPEHTGDAADLDRELSDRRSRDPRLLDADHWLPYVLGVVNEPLIAAPVLWFHSYRKVREGSHAIDTMVDSNRLMRGISTERSSGNGTISTFKALLIQALMARSGLFEGVDVAADAALDQLNELMEGFARGRVDKLRPGPDGTVELRVAPTNGGPSYSFDGLSSGQKEIIATLFLIWHTTRESPSVVLIDEPELHLNAEWQRLFVRTLWSLAPWNQYIMATHSEEVFGSVTEDRRILLQPG